jgi:hypothetical protein
MILLYAASRDPRRGESPVMCARTVQVAAPPGEVVSNTGKQNRKVLAAPVMGASASAAGATTLLRQKHGNCLSFLHSLFLPSARWHRYSLLPFPSSDGSHACAAEIVKCGKENIYEPQHQLLWDRHPAQKTPGMRQFHRKGTEKNRRTNRCG